MTDGLRTFDGGVAIVTGAASGIARAISEALAHKVANYTIDAWNRVIAVNLGGVANGVQAAYPAMIRQGFGHIVNTASMAGLTISPSAAGYSATK